jgi:hypothetical protein
MITSYGGSTFEEAIKKIQNKKAKFDQNEF